MPAKSRNMKEHIIKDTKGKLTKVLPIVTIYGANASGKTNLVNAIEFMKNLVLKGTNPDRLINVIPHRLDPNTEFKPSKFEIVFKHSEVIYTYGFVISDKIVHEEWLFGYFTSQESRIFERITKNDKTEVEPGKRLIENVEKVDFIKFIAQGTRPNQLFLTEANNKNIDLIKPIIHWFREHLHIIRPNSQYSLLTLRAHKDHDFIDYLSKFLHIADTGISSIKCESEEYDPNKHLSDLPEEMRAQIKENLSIGPENIVLIRKQESSMAISKDEASNNKSLKFLQLKTEHIRTDGTFTLFETSSESDGTRRLMDLAPMLLDIWERDRVFIIDELDRSLHTHISRLFIQTCIAGVIQRHARGQFIMTTHDTNLLDRSLLRRDEILFMEKDKFGASHLTSLADYKITEGLNYENGYINGRFGAIPFIGNIVELLK
jgi:AAA15 family ATPase/GTPase